MSGRSRLEVMSVDAFAPRIDVLVEPAFGLDPEPAPTNQPPQLHVLLAAGQSGRLPLHLRAH